MKLLNTTLISIFLSFGIYAQVSDQELEDDGLVVLDTLSGDFISLKEVTLYPRPVFASQKTLEAYATLRYMIHRVYPFAKTASERLEKINDRISKIPSRSGKKKYFKILQKFMEQEFSEKLKKYTIWEGQILIKLIHRQTGITCYELIRGFRSGFRAFTYNIAASFFDLTLKKEYHPERYYKDFLIEKILTYAFEEGTLDRQKSKLENIDYSKLSNLWRAYNGNDMINYFDVKSNDEKESITFEKKTVINESVIIKKPKS